MTKAGKEEKIKIQLKMKQLIIKRVTYVGDRLALGVGVSFGLLIGYILLVYNIDNIIELNPWFFVFMFFLGIFFSILKSNNEYNIFSCFFSHLIY